MELQGHLVVREWRKHVGRLDEFGGHVDVVSTVDHHGVERLQIFEERHTHHLDGGLGRGRQIERRGAVYDADDQRVWPACGSVVGRVRRNGHVETPVGASGVVGEKEFLRIFQPEDVQTNR